MLSPSFFESEFIWQTELPLSFERKEIYGIGVLGVLIHECDFNYSLIKNFEIIPKSKARLKAVSSWRSKKKCWNAIKSAVKISIYNSYDRLPEPLKYKPETLSSKANAEYKKQFFNPTIQRFDKILKKKRRKVNPKKKRSIWDILKGILLKIVIALILVIILFFLFKLY